MYYESSPIDTGDIILPEETFFPTKKITGKAHNVWTVGRISKGRVYGIEKEVTPLLVPSSELPESEKNYDKNSVLEL